MANLRNKRISNLVVGNFANQSCSPPSPRFPSFWRTGGYISSSSLPFTEENHQISRIRNASLAFSNFEISFFPFTFSTSKRRRRNVDRVMAVFLLKIRLFFAPNQTSLFPLLLLVDDGSMTSFPRRNKGEKLIDEGRIFVHEAGFGENKKRR